MEKPSLLALFLAPVAVAAAPSNLPAELKYDRLWVDYAGGDDTRAYGVGARALLGGCILVGGGVHGKTYGDLGTTSGRGADFALGYAFALGKGDLIASAGYGQVQAAGQDGGRSLALEEEARTCGLTWRQRLDETWEYTLGFAHVSEHRTVRATVGASVTTTMTREQGGVVNLGLRYLLDAHVDLVLGYALGAGGNLWSVSTGYTF